MNADSERRETFEEQRIKVRRQIEVFGGILYTLQRCRHDFFRPCSRSPVKYAGSLLEDDILVFVDLVKHGVAARIRFSFH